jgi:hypothetical protein
VVRGKATLEDSLSENLKTELKAGCSVFEKEFQKKS